MAWTRKQQQVIDERDSSILVSAAAGSGKTAVLVERILSKVLDKANPKNIDEFLVVTFTKAAAAQMRDKIASKLELELLNQPENEHLVRQLVLVNRADITTIDSFCLRMVKEHFSLLNIDSTINIGDNGMMELLKSDVLDDIFEEKYKSEKNAEGVDFYTLVDIFCSDKDDVALKEQILKIYNMASSYPVPEKWLKDAKAALAINNVEEFEELPWVKGIISMAHSKLKDALYYVEQGRTLCEEDGGPDKNYELTNEDEAIIQGMISANSYQKMHIVMESKFPRLKTCKGDAYNEELVEEFKATREKYKEIVKSLNIFKPSAEDVVTQIQDISTYLIPLIELVEEFSARYMEVKLSKKLMEFSDIEHLAYKLCCQGYDKDGNVIPTEIGKKISERYEEIFIDEYQDSNYLQEDILCSVSGIPYGRYNMFMVGDVKQSIYRFRMARPDLFVEKYNRFKAEGNEVKIELKNNFRSRDMVLLPVNYFFYQLMGEDLGGIAYNEDIALVPSKEFPEPEENISDRISDSTDIIFIDADSSELSDEGKILTEEESNLEKLELEARVIAKRIIELTDEKTGQYIYDEELDSYRLAEYRDIVILSRSIKGFGDTLYNTLMASDIPVYLEDSKGYFDAVEIRIILALLSVVDNSRQDIPLASVLMSPMGNLTENDVAVICDYAYKSMDKKACLFDKCLLYLEEFENPIADKLNRIISIINTLKEEKKNTSISDLIWRALDLTGYYLYASAMPMGNKRKANINMLIEKAKKYEDGYYKGLFNFLRYIDKIRVNDVDFGEANILSDEDNVVRIISMHKSKGLEYPIVFVSGLGRQFNNMDTKESMIIHSDYYLSSMQVNNKGRFKKNTFIRDCFKQLIKRDNMAEEMRVLYVAMTRAKEKLILTGCDNKVQKLIDEADSINGLADILLPYSVRGNSPSFMRCIIMAMARYDSLKNTLFPKEFKGEITTTVYTYKDAIGDSVKEVVKKGLKLDDIKEQAENTPKEGYYEEILENFEFIYPYDKYTDIKSKMSISEIKKMKAFDGASYDVSEDVSLEQDLVADDNGSLTDDVKEGETFTITGAERGTIIHKFMELLPFEEDICSTESLKDFKQTLLENGIFNEEEINVINLKKINNMLKSSLGKRMIKAAKDGRLYKEQQFSAGLAASSIYKELEPFEGEDVVIVQGIIDGFFYEEDEIIIMDYKTDRATKEELIGRYRAQLDYYGKILSMLTGKKVKEKIIYSFYLDNEIQL